MKYEYLFYISLTVLVCMNVASLKVGRKSSAKNASSEIELLY